MTMPPQIGDTAADLAFVKPTGSYIDELSSGLKANKTCLFVRIDFLALHVDV